MSQYQAPTWERMTDLLSGIFSYGVAGLGGVGIIVYQAVTWFLYTTFNYMSLEWFFKTMNVPFFTDSQSWYNHPDKWEQFHRYFVPFFQWMPLSVTLIIVGKFIGGWIDDKAMNYGRAHRRPNTDNLPGTRGLGA